MAQTAQKVRQQPDGEDLVGHMRARASNREERASDLGKSDSEVT